MTRTKLQKRFEFGDLVLMTDDAIENYGEKWRGQELVVTHAATAYMNSKEFYDKGQPQGYHPGFDESAGCALYDLAKIHAEGSEAIHFSLYDWELR